MLEAGDRSTLIAVAALFTLSTPPASCPSAARKVPHLLRRPSPQLAAKETWTMQTANDPIQMLIDDHEKVKHLFNQYEQASSVREKQEISQRVFQELMVHSALEKDIFYPAMRDAGDEDDKKLVEHSYHDHAEAEQLIAQLKAMRPGDAQYDAKFRELKDAVLEHAQEEEDEMFPDAKKYIGDRLPQVGQEMRRMKQDMMGRMAA
jgi:hemerythrin superfamily protein